MKKLLAVVLCLVMVLAFAACNPEKEFEGTYSKTLLRESNGAELDFKVKLLVKVNTKDKMVLSVSYVDVEDANLYSSASGMNNPTDRDAFLAKLANTSFDLYKNLPSVGYYNGLSATETAQNEKYKENFSEAIGSGGTNSKAFIINAVANILTDNNLI